MSNRYDCIRFEPGIKHSTTDMGYVSSLEEAIAYCNEDKAEQEQLGHKVAYEILKDGETVRTI